MHVKSLLARALLIVCVMLRPAQAEGPNMVVVLIDDMGLNDPGFCGNPAKPTPELDAIAQRGMVFDQAYAAAPNCAPTRASLLTGQYTPRHGVFTVVDERNDPGQPSHRILAARSRPELDTAADTVAEALARAGYRTGMVGMWNLGRGRSGPCTPTGQGFGRYVHPRDMGFAENAYWNTKREYLCDRMTDAALEFIREPGGPFMLYLAYHSVHAPFDPPAELLKQFNGDALDATLSALDRNLGRLAAALPSNTYLFVTSDNGSPEKGRGITRSGKGSLYEGGIRVPFVVQGPLIAAGTTCSVPVLSIDLYPTLKHLAGIGSAAPQVIDGENLVPLWSGGALARASIFWHFPCYAGRGTPSSAVRSGRYKLIEFFETDRRELYDLDQDPAEQRDLSASDPARAAALQETLHAWQRDLNAPCPRDPNPAFDPSARSNRRRNAP